VFSKIPPTSITLLMLQIYQTGITFTVTVHLVRDGCDELRLGAFKMFKLGLKTKWHLSLTVPMRYTNISLNKCLFLFL